MSLPAKPMHSSRQGPAERVLRGAISASALRLLVAALVIVGAGVSYSLFIGDREPGSDAMPRDSANTLPLAARPAAPEVGELPRIEARGEGSGNSPITERDAVDRETATTDPEAYRDVRGVVVRAADESRVWRATIVALARFAGASGPRECARSTSDSDGNFVIRIPRGVERFQVWMPGPGSTRDDPRSEVEVGVSSEWANGDPAGNEVRLSLDSGWRLDLRVLDSAARPRSGAVVRCGARRATTDPDGRCALLDLPAGDALVELRADSSANAAPDKHTVSAPAGGRLRKEAELTLK